MIELKTIKRNLIFKMPAGTSRGILTYKPSWFFVLKYAQIPGKTAIGECGLLPGLSFDDRPDYETILGKIVAEVNSKQTLDIPLDLKNLPSIRFGFEMLKKDYSTGMNKIFFKTDFTGGKYKIPVNGLIWMGDKRFMFEQIKTKLDEGWRCIKIKIGAINFEDELALIKYIRSEFNKDDVELRVDANGAFSVKEAPEFLKRLSDFDLHSIEQPVKAGQPEEMAKLCASSPLPVALDEELIGINDIEEKKELISTIKPHYIVLKPSLTGGWQASQEWIDIAGSTGTGYWVTSALESNIGLNAIAQWTATLNKGIIHGLGTGKLYKNNIKSPLVVEKGFLYYDKNKKWEQI